MEERRALLVQLVDQVYLRHDALLAIRPTLRAWPLLHAVYREFYKLSESGPGGHTPTTPVPASRRKPLTPSPRPEWPRAFSI